MPLRQRGNRKRRCPGRKRIGLGARSDRGGSAKTSRGTTGYGRVGGHPCTSRVLLLRLANGFGRQAITDRHVACGSCNILPWASASPSAEGSAVGFAD